MISTLIVDDEAPARAKLTRYVEQDPRLRLIGAAVNGAEALELVEQLKPQLLICDIHMPAINGLDLVRLLPSVSRPLVVFSTAYDHHALEAFEVAAADYLLKPYGRQRFTTAMDRVVERLIKGQTNGEAEVLSNIKEAVPQQLAVRHLKRVKLLPIVEITHVVAEQGISSVYTADQRYWTDETLLNLSNRLGDAFFRIHRSCIIRLQASFELEPWQDGRLRLHLADGTVLVVARGPAKELRKKQGF